MESVVPQQDRKLGDEWADWDGRESSTPPTTRAGKRLFVALGFIGLLLLGGAALGAWYLVAPRLLEWHSFAPAVLLVAIGGCLAVEIVVVGALVCSFLLGWSVPPSLAALARRLFAIVAGLAFTLGRWLSISRDQIAHSFVLVHNALALGRGARMPPGRVLVLLPRCLRAADLAAARALGAELGVKVAVAGGGEIARERIREHRPAAVVGVACERDLLSGIRDVGGRVKVLGIPNARPEGPCRNTLVNLHELRAAVLTLLSGEPAARGDDLRSGEPVHGFPPH